MPQIKPTRGICLNRSHPLSRGLVGLWLFNEGSGGQAFDLSGNNNHGTFVGDVSWVSGKYGPATYYPGTIDYINIGDRPSLKLTSQISLYVCCRISADTGGYETLISKGYASAPGRSWQLAWHTGLDRIYFFVRKNDDSGTINANIPIVYDTSVWYHIFATFDGTYAYVYVGTTKSSASGAGAGIYDSTEPVIIGSENDENLEFNGDISHAAIWNYILSASEVALREPFCMFERKISPAYFFVPAIADWIGINSSHYDSHCGDNGTNTVEKALGGDDSWYHAVNETHWVILDLLQSYSVSKIAGRSNGEYDPLYVNLYVSDDKGDWGAAVAQHAPIGWHNQTSFVEIPFNAKTGRFVKIEIATTEDGVNHYLTFGATIPFTILDVYGEAVTPPTGIPILRRRRAG